MHEHKGDFREPREVVATWRGKCGRRDYHGSVAQVLQMLGLHQHQRASTLITMNFTEEQITRHAQNVMRKQERIETLEALLATHEAMGDEPDSCDVKELKERIRVERMQLMVMR